MSVGTHTHAPVLRIVLADDHPVVREGLKLLVNAQADMRVVGEAADGEEAWRAAKELQPDVLVIDLSMPTLGGAEATQRVRRDCPEVKVLALTVHEERLYVTQLLRAGASGYILKRAASADLVRAVRTVAAGGTYIDPSVAGALVEEYLDAGAGQPADDSLSEREREVLSASPCSPRSRCSTRSCRRECTRMRGRLPRPLGMFLLCAAHTSIAT